MELTVYEGGPVSKHSQSDVLSALLEAQCSARKHVTGGLCLGERRKLTVPRKRGKVISEQSVHLCDFPEGKKENGA